MTRSVPDHGTASRYRGDPRAKKTWDPCRCEACTTAHRRACKIRDLRKARGIPGTQAADPIADHIDRLVASGRTMLDIERESRVDVRGLYNIRYRRQKTVRNATAIRILTLQPGCDPYLTDAAGTRRRLQALAAAGYSMAWTARQVGMSERGVQEIGRGRWATVTKPTRQAIADVYEQYATTCGPSSWTRAQAARHGWRDATYWDDMGRIDDPGFDPDKPLSRNELAALRREEIVHLAWCGYEPDQIHGRLGGELGLSTIQAIVLEYRTGQRRERRKPVAA